MVASSAPRGLLGPSPAAVAELVARVGGQILESYPLPDGEVAYLLWLPSYAAKVSLLDDLAWLDAHDPRVRRVAELVCSRAADALEQIEILHAFVRGAVVHTDEVIETFSPPLHVLRTGIGDCDDSARALCALLRALGHDSRFATLGDPPHHVAAQVRRGGRWHWLETTIDAMPGEHPLDAADRLGIDTRADLR